MYCTTVPKKVKWHICPHNAHRTFRSYLHLSLLVWSVVSDMENRASATNASNKIPTNMMKLQSWWWPKTECTKQNRKAPHAQYFEWMQYTAKKLVGETAQMQMKHPFKIAMASLYFVFPLQHEKEMTNGMLYTTLLAYEWFHWRRRSYQGIKNRRGRKGATKRYDLSIEVKNLPARIILASCTH